MNDTSPTLADLQQDFLRLRDAWQHGWVGLGSIASDCMSRLGCPDNARLACVARALRDCVAKVAQAVEADGRERQLENCEPAYHNRLHIADTLRSLTCLLLATRAEQGRAQRSEPTEAEWIMLLAMIGHDYLHTGRVNQFPGELESRSARALQSLMQDCGVPEEIRSTVEKLILMTDPACVRRHHESLRGQPFDPASFGGMAMLLQESDILASAMPVTGMPLTRQLASEWALFSEAMASALLKPASRIAFLRDIAMFSSPASRRLGIASLMAQEIGELERATAGAAT